LTLGENTQLKVTGVGNKVVQFSLEQGQIILVADGSLDGNAITILEGGASVVIKNSGWYRVTAGNAPELAVIQGGDAEINYGASRTKIGRGREVALTPQLTQQRFQTDEKDALYRWTKVLNEYGLGAAPSAPPNPEDSPEAHQAAAPPPQAPGLWQIFQRGDVPISVVVLDSQHQPVDDLRSTDFRVTDGGKEQQILSFDVRRSKRPLPTIIVLDLLNARMSDRARAVNEIGHTVQELESTDDLYLYVLAPNGGVYAVHPIPDKPAGIDAQTPPWSSQVKTLLDKTIKRVNQLRTADMRDIDVRTQASLQNVEGLAALLARFPGRKDFIWVTHGVPDISYWNDYTAGIAKLGTKLNWADIAVYTVQQSATERISMDSGTTLAMLSQLTGGRIYGTDSAQDAIEQSRTDSRIEYSLTYKAPSSQTGKLRKIHVTCDRPGTQVLSQQGYYNVR
jgi:VWFA-related protein